MSKKTPPAQKPKAEQPESHHTKKDAVLHALHAPVKHKLVTIKHHHAKPFRKRHVAGFTSFLIVGMLLIGLVAGYNSTVREGIDNARQFIAETVSPSREVQTTVRSTYGFSITYDSSKFYATGIDTQSGDLFMGAELAVNRAYEILRIAPTLTDTEQGNTNMTLHYFHDSAVADQNNIAALEQEAIKDITSKANLQVKKTGTSNVEYGGKMFTKSEWEFQSDNKVLAGFSPTFTTFTTVHEGKTFVIEIINNAISVQKANQYEEVLRSLYFGKIDQSALAPQDQQAAFAVQKNRNLLETALFGKLASAAEASSTTSTAEQISAKFSPAVVKIYNVFCKDIYFDGALAIADVCSGTTGSGFFINSEGHIGTNGHVATSDPLDLLIQISYNYYTRGSATLLNRLITEAGIKTTDLPSNGTSQERAQALFDMLYDIEPSRVEGRNEIVNLLVSLGKEQPDVKELVKVTNNTQSFPEQATIKQAKLIGSDFRTIDGFTKFVKSDVAIIKIEGSNYPVTKLGSLTGLMQGADLSILGYPGNASNNGIVDTETTSVTLTSGKVSSIKNALGSDKKLIETDTTIGHGNSGGPAFNDAGEVVGIATYTAAKVNDGTYNYVRDVKDLTDLAGTTSVTISSQSETQKEWEKGYKLFSEARYSKSLASFKKVKQLYASHPKVDEFIAAAELNIKNGKDVKDFPVVLALVGGVVFLLAAAGVAFMIHRHKKAHNVYKAHVGAGMMQPLQQGAAPQTVAYDPAHIAAQKNVVAMHQYMQQAPQQSQQTQQQYGTPVQQPMASAMPVAQQPSPVQQPIPPTVQPMQQQPVAQPFVTGMPTQTIQPTQPPQPLPPQQHN